MIEEGDPPERCGKWASQINGLDCSTCQWISSPKFFDIWFLIFKKSRNLCLKMTPNSSITSRNLEYKLKGNQIRKISYFVEAKCAMAKRLATL